MLSNNLFGYAVVQFFSNMIISQNFLVDIKAPMLGLLPVLAFEGGTRRNIPKFEVHFVSDPSILFLHANFDSERQCQYN